MTAPILRAYPKATVVAEKLHAVCVLGMANSRMKDFFDLSVLLHDQAINDEELLRAIEATFLRRATPLPDALPVGLSDAFAGDATKQTQWRAFLRRNQLQARELAEVVAGIRSRVMRLGVGTP